MYLDKKKSILIVSPHFDDAIISCTGLMLSAIDMGIATEIFNVFTKIQINNLKLSKVIKDYVAEDLMLETSNVDAYTCKKWIDLRNQEDDVACKYIGCKRTNLNFVDAIFRTRQNRYMYDSEEKLFGEWQNERQIENNLNQEFENVCENYMVCLFPMGVGNHVDHQILHAIGVNMRNIYKNVSFYYEFPYSQYIQFPKEKRVNYDISEYLDSKINAIGYYKSQLNGLYGGKGCIKNAIPSYEVYHCDFRYEIKGIL